MAKDYSYTPQRLYQVLNDPNSGADQIPPLDSEVLQNGQIDLEAYTARVSDPNFSYVKNGQEIYPRFDRKLELNKPIDKPTTQQLMQHIFDADSILDETLDAVTIMAGTLFDELALGINEEKLSYVSQDDYKKKKLMGMKDKDIWPHLAETKNRTFKDWTTYFGKKLGVLSPDEQDSYWEGWNPLGEFGPNASDKLQIRAKHYYNGGEVNEQGIYVDKNGNQLSRDNIRDMSETTRESQYAPEFYTKEQYEKRKSVGTNWNDSFINTVKQKVLYEFVGPKVDAAVQEVFNQAAKKANDPDLQAIQRWSESISWKDAVISDWSALTIKANNAILSGVRSVASSAIVGTGTYLATRNPRLSTNVAALTMTAIDAKSMYVDTFNYAINDLGMNEIDAANFARDYYFAYASASYVWERLPFSMAFTRAGGGLKSEAGKRILGKMTNRMNELFKAGPVTRNKWRATLVGAAAEGTTEAGQYTTEIALTADYRQDKTFDDLFDVNQAIDAIVGGAFVGGVMGGATGGRALDDKGTVESEPGTNVIINQEEDLDSDIDIEGASPTTTFEVPKSDLEYIELIANRQIFVERPDIIGDILINKIKKSNEPETELTKKMINQSTNRDMEENPIRKIKDMVQNSDKGLDIIDDLPNLSEDQKQELKDLIVLNIKDSQKNIIQSKKDTTVADDKALENIDEKIDEKVVSDYLKGDVKIDEIIYDKVTKQIEEQAIESAEKTQDADAIIQSQQDTEQDPELLAKLIGDTSIPTRAEIEKQGAKTQKGDIVIEEPGTQTPTPSKQKAAPKITDKQLNDKITEANDRAIKTATGKDLTNPEVMAEIDELRKERIARIKLKYKKKTPKQLETLQKSLSKPGAIKDEGIREDSLKAIEELQEERKPFAKDKKSKAAEESNLQDSPNFYVESEKSIVSKLTNKRLDEVIKEKKEKADKESEGLSVEENMQLSAEISSLESEKERRQEAKEKKKAPKVVQAEKKKSITLDQENEALFQEYLESIGQAQSIGRVVGTSKQVEGVTSEQADAVSENIEDTKEELNNINCIDKKES